MTDRISKVSVGTVGSRPCEISLNKVLMELNDVKVTHRVMNRYQTVINTLKKLKVLLPDRKFYVSMVNVVREHQFAQWEKSKNHVPKIVYSLLRCCMTAQFREALS